uniref:Uncharacterized protein n=1 Tax=Pseudo-nitzschia australis TaxID=44445 RepID=A0A7S4AL50_9STRA|mmetsp:Transcript_6696/g.15237  ORF Transcript_6696/g.15237 Transcript_6696/m.15237 type:complete len:235 (-) Transcript_6696:394-1098(-)
MDTLPDRRRSIQFADQNDHQSLRNYGSIDAEYREGTDYDGTTSGELGSILEDDDDRISLNGTCYPSGDVPDDLSYTSDDVNERLSEISSKSFGLTGDIRMSINNIMVQPRNSESFSQHGDNYQLVPSKLKKNVRVVEDENMYGGDRGRLYLAADSFFKNTHETKYALSTNPDIYKRVFSEVSDAYNVPCGLFFCCHGGDGAHTGVSHDDYVDIKLAWIIFLFVIGSIVAVDFMG